MSDEAALLAAIVAHPDEDTPRLMYADWLQENGQTERAEFIRLQCERVRLGYRLCFSREAELLARHREEWTAPFASWAKFEDLLFRRGFVEQLTCAASAYAQNSEALFRLAPVVELWIPDAAAMLDQLLLIPRPAHIRVRAGELSPPTSWYAGDGFVDLLPLAPPKIEPYLRHGSWLVLAFRRYSGPNLVTAHRFLRYVQQNVSPQNQSTNYGLRPLNAPNELQKWCSVPDPYLTPNWLWFHDGQLVQHRTGHEPPDDWQEGWLAG